jgi:hypothetical protein
VKSILITGDGLTVTTYDESLSSSEKNEETPKEVSARDYLNDNKVTNLDKKK